MHFLNCGAKTIHPVYPDQFCGSYAMSFSTENGEPAFPNMLSVKSRMLTKLAGTKNLTSMRFSLCIPGMAGHTTGVM